MHTHGRGRCRAISASSIAWCGGCRGIESSLCHSPTLRLTFLEFLRNAAQHTIPPATHARFGHADRAISCEVYEPTRGDTSVIAGLSNASTSRKTRKYPVGFWRLETAESELPSSRMRFWAIASPRPGLSAQTTKGTILSEEPYITDTDHTRAFYEYVLPPWWRKGVS